MISAYLPLNALESRREGVKPLNVLLLEAITIAKRREPDLTDLEIAARAGLARSNISRAKTRCGAATLAAILDALKLDLAVVDAPAEKHRRP